MRRDHLLRIGLGIVLVVGPALIIWSGGGSTGPLPTAPAVTTVSPVDSILQDSTTSPTTQPATSATVDPTTSTVPNTTTASPAPVFQSSIDTVGAAELHASWRDGCPVGVDGLRAVTLSHWGFDGKVHDGTLIAAADVAEDIVDIMHRLFAAGFPIERMEPADVYDGDDNRSMAANNTSAFNCRPVTGGSGWSEHSYGTAIDVNPLVNPYVRGGTVLPPEGAPYADRSLDAPGMIHDGDEVVEAFAVHGWKWGGAWASPKDYQHFSTTGR